MESVRIILDGDGAFSDVDPAELDHGKLEAVAGLESGMMSGNASVALRIRLDNGRTVLAETSLKLLYTAAQSLAARYPESLK